MPLLEILYIFGVIISICASLPQVRQLVTVKASDEFSLTTWTLWLFTQCVTLIYVISLHNTLLIAAGVLWTAFYVAMVYLIIHYRHIRKPVRVEVSAPEA
jgi:uncharacterized protein with PQ loop repeat